MVEDNTTCMAVDYYCLIKGPEIGIRCIIGVGLGKSVRLLYNVTNMHTITMISTLDLITVPT
jgi:hypothetical protein